MSSEKIKLHGFNNLTKSLSFSLYDISWARSEAHRYEYAKYIDHHYNANRLTDILYQVVEMIGANVLNIARQDYDPQGASVTILMSEAPTPSLPPPKPATESVVAHLDKSHICVHTYPENHPQNGISTFRADIEVSTCGIISPLKVLNFLIHSFDSDVVTVDYRVRGFTRDVSGIKHYIDHEIRSIQDYLSADIHQLYDMIDVNIEQENIFHTKMVLKDFELTHYLFGSGINEMGETEIAEAKSGLQREIQEIFYARNIS
ncbi:adenosylmethionine decarboxylase [Catenovulum adriaticum]|uniref:S-adenosylmethionine decarboxylase proenzyme n=1 Tax=Catenovulum adriaticum TaxID=2984846 RepID=A0ABY7AKT8_9ALTE|nr:adenosylmethionine decarboxylase [Catenovulum sp. TS8]WAJ69357.1 adenosylmethionine decarboxylase [Catenovulum sp. TS8]